MHHVIITSKSEFQKWYLFIDPIQKYNTYARYWLKVSSVKVQHQMLYLTMSGTVES